MLADASKSSRWGGWIALVQALLYLLVPINILAIQSQAFTVETWVKAAAIRQSWPLLLIDPALNSALSITLMLITIHGFNHLSDDEPQAARLLLIAGSIGAALLLGNAGVYLHTIDVALSSPANDPSLVSPVVAALAAVSGGLMAAAYFAMGWALLLWGSLALRRKVLPRPLAILAVITGCVGILGLFNGIISFFLVPVFMFAWSLWLALFWLRKGAIAATQPA